jgi:hypothetical protein
MLGKKLNKAAKQVANAVKPDPMKRGDIFYTTGRDDYYECSGLHMIRPEDVKRFDDGDILYEVRVERKVRVNNDVTITEIK